ncbi:MAG: histidine kinase dimerization/phospho-acceptor domain-containing protein, partial [Polyangiaceae bacterium]
MTVTFREKLLASHVALVLAVVFIVIFQLDRTLSADLIRQLDQRLEQQARGAAQWGAGDGRRHPEKIAARLALVLDADVTLFDQAGKMVGGSAQKEGASLEESGPEVASALRGEIGRASRVPAGMPDEMHFVAVPAADGWVVRIAVPLSDINATLHSIRARLLLAAIVALVAALALGLLASRVAARPLRAMTVSATRIAEGDFDIDVSSNTPDEFGMLSRSLSSLAAQLKARLGELTAERDRLSAILEGMAEGVLVIDPSGEVLLANPASATILGAEPPLSGKRIDAVCDEKTSRFLASTLAGRTTRETEVETSDERFIAIYVRPLEERAGGGVVSVLRDMTPIRRVLAMKREFMANASHELRTPVTAIQGYAETLLRGTADEATARQFVEIIERHDKRLGGLVDDVLKLSELEDRPPEHAVKERVDVGGVTTLVVETIHTRAKNASIQVNVNVPAGVEITGDPLGLEQVLENLVDNAVKYGKNGG